MQPCKTRWNSIADMAMSMLDMRQAFDAIRGSTEKSTEGLRDMIPSEHEFNLLNAISPLLQIIKHYSTEFEADKPVIQNFLVHVHNMKGEINKKIKEAKEGQGIYQHLVETEKQEVAKVMESFQEEFATRRARYGNDKIYAVAAVLNPQYKGVPLFKMRKYDETIDHIVNTHYTTQEILAGDGNRTYDSDTPMDEDTLNMSDADRDNRERLIWLQSRRTNSQPPSSGGDELPIRSELQRYELCDSCKPGDDHLEWWSRHAKEFPLLAELARDTFCMQITSCNSERVFSLGGRVVSKLRTGLSMTRTEMIIFTQQNRKYIPKRLTSWKLHNQVNISILMLCEH